MAGYSSRIGWNWMDFPDLAESAPEISRVWVNREGLSIPRVRTSGIQSIL